MPSVPTRIVFPSLLSDLLSLSLDELLLPHAANIKTSDTTQSKSLFINQNSLFLLF